MSIVSAAVRTRAMNGRPRSTRAQAAAAPTSAIASSIVAARDPNEATANPLSSRRSRRDPGRRQHRSVAHSSPLPAANANPSFMPCENRARPCGTRAAIAAASRPSRRSPRLSSRATK